MSYFFKIAQKRIKTHVIFSICFGKSKEKEECEKSCQEPCHHTDYEISLSYAGLQRNVFIKKLNAALNDTETFPGFKNFLNIYSEKKQYIE